MHLFSLCKSMNSLSWSGSRIRSPETTRRSDPVSLSLNFKDNGQSESQLRFSQLVIDKPPFSESPQCLVLLLLKWPQPVKTNHTGCILKSAFFQTSCFWSAVRKCSLLMTSSFMESPYFSGIFAISVFTESWKLKILVLHYYEYCMQHICGWNYLNYHNGISESIALQHIQREPENDPIFTK